MSDLTNIFIHIVVSSSPNLGTSVACNSAFTIRSVACVLSRHHLRFVWTKTAYLWTTVSGLNSDVLDVAREEDRDRMFL